MSKMGLSPFFFWYAFVCTCLQHKMAFKRSAVRSVLSPHRHGPSCTPANQTGIRSGEVYDGDAAGHFLNVYHGLLQGLEL